MIFSRLVGLHFIFYVFGTLVSLTTLYTFVDILEKFARYHNTSFFSIMRYASISFIPNFISLSPIGCLFGSILLLREWVIHDQFSMMAIHGISRKHFISIIFVYSFFITSVIFILQETIGSQYSRQIVQAKNQLLNKTSQESQWFRLTPISFVMGLGEGHQQYYLLQTGPLPSIAALKTIPNSQTATAEIVNLQQATLTQTSFPILDQSSMSVLAYSSSEESFIKTLPHHSSTYGQRIISDLSFFYFKVLFLPFFIMICFLIAIQRPLLRWVYAGIPYLAFGISHTCMQLLGPLQGIAFSAIIILLLIVFFLFKIA